MRTCGFHCNEQMIASDHLDFHSIRNGSMDGLLCIVTWRIQECKQTQLNRIHNRKKNFKQFKPGGDNPTLSGPAIWLTPDATKQPAAHNIGSRSQEFREGTNVMPVYAQSRSPLLLDDKLSIEWAREVFADGSREFPDLLAPKTIEELKKGGYDSIIHADPYGNRGGEQEIIMFEPNKIKSAIGNRGTYDITSPDINEAQGGLATHKRK